MYIRSITVENFLPFQGEQHIDFSVDKERNVTLVMGNNGAGKTSLAQAFEWCLYGTVPKESPQVINAYVKDHITPGSYRYAAVEIELEKDGKIYSIARKQRYSRRENGKLDRPGQFEFGIMYKENGETKQVAANEQVDTINRLLSNQLSHYFFFDGEHVKSMRGELEGGKSTDFADAVKTILGLQPVASALEHLKAPGNRSSVERWFNRQFDLAGNQDLEAKRRRIDTLGKSIERFKEDKLDAEADESAAKTNVEKYKTLLKENEASEKAQRDVERTERNKKEAEKNLTIRRDGFFAQFRKMQYRFLIERLVRDAQEELADEDKISKGIPSVDDKTIKFILERGECICGTKFSTGDEIAQHLYGLLEYVPPKDLGTYISEFDKECRIRTENESTLTEDLADAYRKFTDAGNGIVTAEKAYEAAKAYLDSLNSVDVSILKNNLRNAEDDLRKAIGRSSNARREISRATSEISQLNSEINQYSVKNAKNREIQQCLKYVEYIHSFLDAYYKEHEASTRAQLAERVDKFFTSMYDGEIHLMLNDDYSVTVNVDEIDTSATAWKTSSGQTLAIILAFILGILDIAKDMTDEKDGLLKGDTYPLVMDAPLSDFDKTRIGTICQLLPNVAEQVIIIIKDTDGDLAEEHMRDKIGRRYTIEKIRDFESKIV